MYRSLLTLILLPMPLLLAQGKKPKPKDEPKVILARPFGVVPGKTTKLTLRGLKLEKAKEVKINPKGSVKLLKKGKVGVPQQMEAARVGDSEVEVEITLPQDTPGNDIELTVITPDGAKAVRKVILDRTPLVLEKEPNDSFKKAQSVKIGDTIQGSISRNQDVDVFRFDAKAGDRVVIEVLAARLGSALDSVLTVYDAAGDIVATSDDIEGSTDSRLDLTLTKAGAYLISLSDAHDQGGQLHPYRLRIRAK